MKQMARDLKIGDQVDSEYLLRDIKTGTSARGSTYVMATAVDKSGSLPVIMWDADNRIPTPGIYRLQGPCNDYKGKPQIKIDHYYPRTSTDDAEFLAISQFPVEGMWAVICESINNMSSEHFANVSRDIFFEQGYEEGFKSSPAATSMHHAFCAGLLEHTSQMCETAEALFQLPFYASNLNKDLCVFGILMHDFCKLMEYSHTAGFKPTTQGVLVGHIALGSAMIFESANRFGVPEVVRDHMMHVVLAHHGKIEYGSPVHMNIPEAAFVHHIDNLHGDVFGMIQKIDANTSVEHVRHGFDGAQLVTKRFNAILEEITAAKSSEAIDV